MLLSEQSHIRKKNRMNVKEAFLLINFQLIIKEVSLLKRKDENGKEVCLLKNELGIELVRLIRFICERVKLSPKM